MELYALNFTDRQPCKPKPNPLALQLTGLTSQVCLGAKDRKRLRFLDVRRNKV